MPLSPVVKHMVAHVGYITATKLITYLLRQWYKQDEDDNPLPGNQDCHDVGNKQQVYIKEENIANPCHTHHNHQ